MYLRDCDLADMRAAAGHTCPSARGCSAGTDGYCVDPTCRDDPTYVDSQGYYCDQWVGDDCTKTYPEWKDWGYTQADEDEILARCPYSCLQCPRLKSPELCDQASCGGVTGNVGIRDRKGGNTGDLNCGDLKGDVTVSTCGNTPYTWTPYFKDDGSAGTGTKGVAETSATTAEVFFFALLFLTLW